MDNYKTKICHISSSHKSRDVRIFIKECRSLAKKGYDVYYVNRYDSFEEDNVKVIGCSFDRKNGTEKNKLKLLKRGLKITKVVYKKALELDCDVYHLHDPELLPYALKLKRKGKKVIFDSHEDYVKQIRLKKYTLKLFQNIFVYIFSLYLKRVLREIDAVIFPALQSGENIFSGQCKNSVIIGNKPLTDELYDKYDENIKKQGKICYIGGLTRARGIENISKAILQTSGKLVLAGNFQSKEFENEILNLTENIEYKGYCNREDILEIYNECSIGIATILKKGQYGVYDILATKIYEYMAMGLPVIITEREYAKRINDKYKFALLVDPNNIEEIAKAINFLLDNPVIAKQMGLNGRKAIKSEFNWTVDEEKLYSLYEEIVLS